MEQTDEIGMKYNVENDARKEYTYDIDVISEHWKRYHAPNEINEWKAIKDKSFWHDIRFSLQRGRHKADANALGFMDEMDKPKKRMNRPTTESTESFSSAQHTNSKVPQC